MPLTIPASFLFCSLNKTKNTLMQNPAFILSGNNQRRLADKTACEEAKVDHVPYLLGKELLEQLHQQHPDIGKKNQEEIAALNFKVSIEYFTDRTTKELLHFPYVNKDGTLCETPEINCDLRRIDTRLRDLLSTFRDEVLKALYDGREKDLFNTDDFKSILSLLQSALDAQSKIAVRSLVGYGFKLEETGGLAGCITEVPIDENSESDDELECHETDEKIPDEAVTLTSPFRALEDKDTRDNPENATDLQHAESGTPKNPFSAFDDEDTSDTPEDEEESQRTAVENMGFIKFLVEEMKADINQVDYQHHDETALTTIAAQNHEYDLSLTKADIITRTRYLLDNGANVHAQNGKGFTPLVCALIEGIPETVTLIIQKDPTTLTKHYKFSVDNEIRTGNALMILCASLGYCRNDLLSQGFLPQVIEQVIKQEDPQIINARDIIGNTALMLAVKEMIHLDWHRLQNNDEAMPSLSDIIKFFVFHGADMFLADADKNTIFHYLARASYSDELQTCISLLRDSDKETLFTLKNHQSKTPFDILKDVAEKTLACLTHLLPQSATANVHATTTALNQFQPQLPLLFLPFAQYPILTATPTRPLPPPQLLFAQPSRKRDRDNNVIPHVDEKSSAPTTNPAPPNNSEDSQSIPLLYF